MISDYVPVGGILTRKNGKKYECMRSGDLEPVDYTCENCDFVESEKCAKVKCRYWHRADELDVYFVRRKDLEGDR